MPKNATINLRVNSEVKEQAAEILEGLGLTLSDAFNLLLHQVRIVRGLPFEVRHGANPREELIRAKSERMSGYVGRTADDVANDMERVIARMENEV